MSYHFSILVSSHQRKIANFTFEEKKKPLSGPTFSNRSYCLNHFCHFLKVYRNLYLFNKMLIYASGKRSVECVYMSRWSLFHFGSDFCINLKNGINFQKKTSNTQQRERKRSLFIMLLQSPLSDVLWLQLFLIGRLLGCYGNWWHDDESVSPYCLVDPTNLKQILTCVIQHWSPTDFSADKSNTSPPFN